MIFDLIFRYRYSAILALLFLWIFFIGAFEPLNSSYYPKCPINYTTGLECPGCGSSRCVKELISLEFVKAFNYNPLAFFALPLIVIISILNIFGLTQYFRSSFIERYGAIIVFSVITIFTLLRKFI